MKYYMRSFVFFLLLLILFAGCGVRDGRNNNNCDLHPVDTMPSLKIDSLLQAKPMVNVYIENSGSMDGFVNGITSFKDVIGNLLVNLKYYYDEDNIQIFFIRNGKATKGEEEKLAIIPACEANIADFARAIDLSWRNDKPNRGQNTNLNNIFKTILDSTPDNTISILISDCIYSIGNGSTVNLLNQEKNTTKDAFLTRFKKQENKHYATMIVKMMSEFNGEYFPYTGDANHFRFNGELPYYICVIADQSLMKQFNENIILKQDTNHGFKNKYIISNEKLESIYYSVLLSTDNVGRFRPQRKCSTPNYIHGIEDVSVVERGGGCSRRSSKSINEKRRLQFAIAVDLSKIDVEESYLLNPSNYCLSNNDFVVKDVFPLEKNTTGAGDWVRISKSKPSHKIILEATGTAYSDVVLSLIKQMPVWIDSCSILDDTSIEKIKGGRSFGLKYWIEGIAEAYETSYKDNKSYFEIEIKIKR